MVLNRTEAASQTHAAHQDLGIPPCIVHWAPTLCRLWAGSWVCAEVEISPGPSLVGEKQRPPLARDEDVPELWRHTATVRNSTRMRFPQRGWELGEQSSFYREEDWGPDGRVSSLSHGSGWGLGPRLWVPWQSQSPLPPSGTTQPPCWVSWEDHRDEFKPISSLPGHMANLSCRH